MRRLWAPFLSYSRSFHPTLLRTLHALRATLQAFAWLERIFCGLRLSIRVVSCCWSSLFPFLFVSGLRCFLTSYKPYFLSHARRCFLTLNVDVPCRKTLILFALGRCKYFCCYICRQILKQWYCFNYFLSFVCSTLE